MVIGRARALMKVPKAPGDVYYGELRNSRLQSSLLQSLRRFNHDFPLSHPDAAAEPSVDMSPGAAARLHHHEYRPRRPKDFPIISVALREEDHAPNDMMASATLVVPRLSHGSEQTRGDGLYSCLRKDERQCHQKRRDLTISKSWYCSTPLPIPPRTDIPIFICLLS